MPAFIRINLRFKFRSYENLEGLLRLTGSIEIQVFASIHREIQQFHKEKIR